MDVVPYQQAREYIEIALCTQYANQHAENHRGRSRDDSASPKALPFSLAEPCLFCGNGSEYGNICCTIVAFLCIFDSFTALLVTISD
jgi:hypothetical protein